MDWEFSYPQPTFFGVADCPSKALLVWPISMAYLQAVDLKSWAHGPAHQNSWPYAVRVWTCVTVWSQNGFGPDILTCSFLISNLVADLHSHSFSIDFIKLCMTHDIIVYSASNQCNVDRQREGQETERKRKGKDRKLDGLDQFDRQMDGMSSHHLAVPELAEG